MHHKGSREHLGLSARLLSWRNHLWRVQNQTTTQPRSDRTTTKDQKRWLETNQTGLTSIRDVEKIMKCALGEKPSSLLRIHVGEKSRAPDFLPEIWECAQRWLCATLLITLLHQLCTFKTAYMRAQLICGRDIWDEKAGAFIIGGSREQVLEFSIIVTKQHICKYPEIGNQYHFYHNSSRSENSCNCWLKMIKVDNRRVQKQHFGF